MLRASEVKSIGLAIGLIILNIALMSLISFTPIVGFFQLVFSIAIVGIVVYGAMLTIGNALAEEGIKKNDLGLAAFGAAILQFAYGSFGGSMISGLTLELQAIALGITTIITTLIALIAGIIVYGTDKNFSKWNSYATFFFIGVLLFGFLGTLYPPLLLAAFLSGLLGFMTYLVHEIWEMRSRPRKVHLNAIGIYVAYMGVFIHILRIVLSAMSEE